MQNPSPRRAGSDSQDASTLLERTTACKPIAGLLDLIEARPATALAAFLLLHFIVWTALPAALYPNLPLDLIEALTYGREWQLGYDKLPPLPWWLKTWRICLSPRAGRFASSAALPATGSRKPGTGRRC